MRTHADIVVPHHDWGFFDRHPDGCVGPVPIETAPIETSVGHYGEDGDAATG